MQPTLATDVRKNWGEFIDSVVRDKPQLVKRNRDLFLSLSVLHLKTLTDGLKLKVNLVIAEGGFTTATFEEIDLVTDGETKEAALQALADDLLEYAEIYFENFTTYYNAPNRQSHFPYVLKAMLCESREEIAKMFYE